MSRAFESTPAVRKETPLLIGLVGPSASGKTFSALRLATGIQRVSGGSIFMIDTEANRGLHYAERFKFHHTPFAAPFSPLDYLAAIQHCVKQGAKIIIIDSMSHEHEGPGGVLEMHEEQLNKLAGSDWNKRNKMNFLAWSKPKQERRRFINTLIQTPVHVICCFRAKPKIKMVKGQEPIELGWQAIAGEEFIYEMTAKCLLLPGANGTPSWQSTYPGEQAMMKLPDQFKGLLDQNQQLSEAIGQRLAEWASGKSPTAAPSTPSNGQPPSKDQFQQRVESLLAKYDVCQARADFDALEQERASIWGDTNNDAKKKLKAASETAAKRIAEAATTEQTEETEELPPEGSSSSEEEQGDEGQGNSTLFGTPETTDDQMDALRR